MASYEVTYTAIYYVEAESVDDAIKAAIEQHEQNPDGDWEAVKEVA